MMKRSTNWRVMAALLLSLTLALAPTLAEARAGSSTSGFSSMGSRGLRGNDTNGAAPLSRSMTNPAPSAGVANA